MMVLSRFDEPIPNTPEGLALALAGERIPKASAIEPTVDISDLYSVVDALDPALRGTELDKTLVQPIHQAVRVSQREASRPEVWHWLCVAAFPELPWRRWAKIEYPAGPAEIKGYLLDEMKEKSLPGRYLGKATVGNLARNTFARLWWAAEILEGDYDLARGAVGNAQLYVDLFERRIGLSPVIAKACVEALADQDEDVVKRSMRRLQQRAKTTRLEFLPQEQVRNLISSS